MDDFTKLENLEKYFKEINCYGNFNYCFTAQTEQSLIPILFGLVGGLITAVMGVKNKKVMGYLVNAFDEGICLIPIIADKLNQNKIDHSHYILLKNTNIEKVMIKKEDIVFYKIKVVMKDKTKYIMKTPKKQKNASYHEDNLNKFIKMYK